MAVRFIRGRRAIVPGKQPHPFRFAAGGDYARRVARAYALPEAALPCLHYWEPVREGADPAEASTLLGPLTTTREQWCRMEKARRGRAGA
jgi:hypothetical protein